MATGHSCMLACSQHARASTHKMHASATPIIIHGHAALAFKRREKKCGLAITLPLESSWKVLG